MDKKHRAIEKTLRTSLLLALLALALPAATQGQEPRPDAKKAPFLEMHIHEQNRFPQYAASRSQSIASPQDLDHWQIETIVTDGYLNGSSLALDSNGFPHIYYYQDLPGQHKRQVKYRHYTGSSWQVEGI